MTSLRLLHLSDLHERGPRESEPYRRRRVLGEAWERNLEALLADGPIDIVCVTGDVAQSGSAGEYEAATGFFDDLLARLGLGRERLFVVPGNHDIARDVERAAWQGLRDAVRGADRSALGRWMAGLSDTSPPGVQEGCRAAVLARQAAYRAWVREGLGRPELVPDDGLGYRVTLPRDGLREPVHIVGLDTAWLSGGDDVGRLLLTDTQLLKRATDENGAPLPGLRVALMHHPFRELADCDQAADLAADHVDVVLRGHLHQTRLRTWRHSAEGVAEFAAGCLYEGHGADRYANGCQVLSLRRGDDGGWQGENHFRAFSPDGGHWHDDDSVYRESRGGRLRWTVAARAAAIVASRAPVPAANPYDPWTPVPPPLFAGRVALLRALDQTLGESRSVALAGDWRIGKSSLLRAWEERARSAGRVVAWVSGEESSGRSPGAFVQAVTGLEAPDEADGAADMLDRWATTVAPRDLPPLVLVDEAEALIRAFPPRFFERLRGLMGRRALVLVLSAVEEIDRVYERAGRTSPFHNLMERHWLGLVEPEAAEQIIARGAGLLEAEDAGLLREWAGRHPFFLALLGRVLVEARVAGGAVEPALERFQDQAAARLRDVWRILGDAEKQALSDSARGGLPVGRRSLKRRGLATEDGRPFGRVLTEWVKEGV